MESDQIENDELDIDSADIATTDADTALASGNTLDRVRALILPILTDLRIDLYDLEFRGGTLRITIDTPAGAGGGVTLDQIALSTRLISKELDAADPVPGRYTLEVSSPGLERTLRTAAHFQREQGKTVGIRLRDVVNGQRRLQGTLVAATETSIDVDVDGEIRQIPIEQIDRARTVYDWTPKPKPGKGLKQPKAPKPQKNSPSTQKSTEV